MNKKSILYKTLSRALSVKRKHQGKGVEMFTDWLEAHIPAHLFPKYGYDKAGNLHVDARVNPTNRTLFVAHVDTVHRDEGANKIRKTAGKWYADGAPLGADDGAGVAILMHLLCGGVPAYYVFTQGEECGGIGAKHLAKDEALLSQFDRAIAFDRRGIDSVITHQGYGRCCSDEFAQALADELSSGNVLMYLGDDTGIYTDTAEFVDVIPECTNISVGYMYEHSDKEELTSTTSRPWPMPCLPCLGTACPQSATLRLWIRHGTGLSTTPRRVHGLTTGGRTMAKRQPWTTPTLR